jgi:hypothetical protein
MFIDKTAFIALASQTKFEKVEIAPGQFVHVRTMNGEERMAYEKSIATYSKGKVKLYMERQRPELVWRTLVAGENQQALMFGSRQELMETCKDASIIEKIFEVSARLNGVTTEDEEDESQGN